MLSGSAAKLCSSLEACSPAAVAASVRLLRADVSKVEGSKVEDSRAEGSKGSAEYVDPRAGCAAGRSEAVLARPKFVTGATSLENASANEQHTCQRKMRLSLRKLGHVRVLLGVADVRDGNQACCACWVRAHASLCRSNQAGLDNLALVRCTHPHSAPRSERPSCSAISGADHASKPCLTKPHLGSQKGRRFSR